MKLALQGNERAKHEREQNQARLPKKKIAPDVGPHHQARHQVNQRVGAMPRAGRKPDRKDDAANPGGRVDEGEHDNKPGLPQRANGREEECAGRGVHEWKLVPAVRINLAALQHRLTGLVPDPVILCTVSAHRMPYRYDDEDHDDDSTNTEQNTPDLVSSHFVVHFWVLDPGVWSFKSSDGL